MKEKHQLIANVKTPLSKGVSTYISFICIGLIPLIVYVFDFLNPINVNLFFLASSLTIISFVFIGYTKSIINNTKITKGIIETLALGVLAALVAYFVGDLLEQLIN